MRPVEEPTAPPVTPAASHGSPPSKLHSRAGARRRGYALPKVEKRGAERDVQPSPAVHHASTRGRYRQTGRNANRLLTARITTGGHTRSAPRFHPGSVGRFPCFYGRYFIAPRDILWSRFQHSAAEQIRMLRAVRTDRGREESVSLALPIEVPGRYEDGQRRLALLPRGSTVDG